MRCLRGVRGEACAWAHHVRFLRHRVLHGQALNMEGGGRGRGAVPWGEGQAARKKNCLSPQEGWSSRRDGGVGSTRRVGASRRLGWWCVGESLLAVVLYRHPLAQFTKSGRSVGDCSSTVWTCQLYNLHGGNRLWWSRDALFDVTHRCWRKLATAVTRQWRHAELKCRPSADRRQSRKRNRPCEPSRTADVEEQLRR